MPELAAHRTICSEFALEVFVVNGWLSGSRAEVTWFSAACTGCQNTGTDLCCHVTGEDYPKYTLGYKLAIGRK